DDDRHRKRHPQILPVKLEEPRRKWSSGGNICCHRSASRISKIPAAWCLAAEPRAPEKSGARLSRMVSGSVFNVAGFLEKLLLECRDLVECRLCVLLAGDGKVIFLLF